MRPLLAVLPLLCQGTTIDASTVMRRDPEHLHNSTAKPPSFPEKTEVEVQASGKVLNKEKHIKHQKAKAAMEKEPPALLEGIFDASLAQVQTEQTLGLREVMFGIFCRRVFDVDVLQKTWTGDLVITISWNDPAASQAIPEGQDETRMATEEARAKVREEDHLASRHRCDQPRLPKPGGHFQFRESLEGRSRH